MDKKQAFGRAIAQLIGNETQAAVARRAGVTETEVSLYKTGKRYPKEKNRGKLAEALGCTPQQLDALEFKYRAGDSGKTASAESSAERRALLEGLKEKNVDPGVIRVIEEATTVSTHASELGESASALGVSMKSFADRLIAQYGSGSGGG